jgi:hypothetical protein
LPKIALQNYCFFLKWQRIAQKKCQYFCFAPEMRTIVG